MKKKITVKDLQNYKGKKKLVCVLIKNIEEAIAADKVGFEMLATGLAGKYNVSSLQGASRCMFQDVVVCKASSL